MVRGMLALRKIFGPDGRQGAGLKDEWLSPAVLTVLSKGG